MHVGADLHVGTMLPLVAESVHVADDPVVDLASDLAFFTDELYRAGPTLIIWCTAPVR